MYCFANGTCSRLQCPGPGTIRVSWRPAFWPMEASQMACQRPQQTPALCPQSMPRTLSRHGVFQRVVFASAINNKDAGFANVTDHEVQVQLRLLNKEVKKVVAELNNAWADLGKGSTDPMLKKTVQHLQRREAGLEEMRKALVAKLSEVVPAAPGVGGGANVNTAVQDITRNLECMAPRFTLVTETAFEGVSLYRVNQDLFVDSNVLAELQAWLHLVERCKTNPQVLIGPPPLLVNGLVKTGKTFVLTQVLLAVLVGSTIYGVGRPDEARVIKLDLVGLPMEQGFQAMLRAMLEEVVMQMQALSFASPALTRAADALAKDQPVSVSMFLHLFDGLPVPVMLLIDEVQNLMLPRVPGSRVIDAGAQATAMAMVKVLVTRPSSQLLVAMTGSNMALFMLQVGKMAPNGIHVLFHSFLADLPSKHEPLVLRKVLEDGIRHLSTEKRPPPSVKECQQLLAVSENAAYLMQALNDFLIRPAGQSMHIFLNEFMADNMMREVVKWGLVLSDFSDAERRAFLGLALTNEGLDLNSLDSIGLRHMLHNLTVPVKQDSSLRVFATSYHRQALQLLIGADGSMRDLRGFLRGNIHIGWVDAFLHLTVAGNLVKAWQDAKQFERAAELLKLPAEQLADEQGAADTWHTQAWFQQVLFHEANQGGEGSGPKVESLEAVSPKSAAGRYKTALQEAQSGGTLSAGGRLAHYLFLLRNMLAHMATPVTRGEGNGTSGSGPAAADLGGQGSGAEGGHWSRGEEGSRAEGGQESGGEERSGAEEPVMGSSSQAAVQALERLRRAGKEPSCAEILSASPAAKPFATVATRYHCILTSVLPPAKRP